MKKYLLVILVAVATVALGCGASTPHQNVSRPDIAATTAPSQTASPATAAAPGQVLEIASVFNQFQSDNPAMVAKYGGDKPVPETFRGTLDYVSAGMYDSPTVLFVNPAREAQRWPKPVKAVFVGDDITKLQKLKKGRPNNLYLQHGVVQDPSEPYWLPIEVAHGSVASVGS